MSSHRGSCSSSGRFCSWSSSSTSHVSRSKGRRKPGSPAVAKWTFFPSSKAQAVVVLPKPQGALKKITLPWIMAFFTWSATNGLMTMASCMVSSLLSQAVYFRGSCLRQGEYFAGV